PASAVHLKADEPENLRDEPGHAVFIFSRYLFVRRTDGLDGWAIPQADRLNDTSAVPADCATIQEGLTSEGLVHFGAIVIKQPVGEPLVEWQERLGCHGYYVHASVIVNMENHASFEVYEVDERTSPFRFDWALGGDTTPKQCLGIRKIRREFETVTVPVDILAIGLDMVLIAFCCSLGVTKRKWRET